QGLATVEVNKKFTFSEDPQDARNVSLVGAGLELRAPVGYDFAWLDELEVYLRNPANPDEVVLVARSTGYQPGETRIGLNLVYQEDLRDFVNSERAIRASFRGRVSQWFGEWPADGFTVRAFATLRFDLY
ncbi:MAG: hypothetical protein KC561_17990, partial [Myxococcales bacterium]|nr:hypothetical protein [Myxococcales bacterium]